MGFKGPESLDRTWFFAVLTALFDGFEIVFVPFASAVNEFLTGFRCRVVEIAREKCPAMARLGRLAATIRAFNLVTLGIDEGNSALIARIGHAKRVRMERAAGVKTLVPADGRLDTRVGADWSKSSLFQHCSVG